MKSGFLTGVAFTAVLASLAVPVPLAAQKNQNHKHHHYKLVDLGTFGGAQSSTAAGRVLNEAGTVVACADTSTSDPNYPNFNLFLSPFGPDPFIFHTLQFRHGRFTDEGALPGINSSCESFLTDSGLIVGGSENGLIDSLNGWPAMEAVVWKDGQIDNLGTFGGNESFAIGANNRGQVIGAAADSIPDPFSVFFGWGTETRAFLWTESQGLQDLGTLGGPDALATEINDLGHIFGASYTSYTPNPLTGIPPFDGFLYKNGKMHAIPNGFGGTQVNPFWANNRDQLVGNASFADEATFHPFLWSNGKFIDLGTFGGTQGEAAWVNDEGEVAGQATTPDSSIVHGFLWKKGVLTDLGTVDGDGCSGGFSINSSRQIVGISGACDGSVLHAFLWEDGGIVDLNTLVPPGSDLELAAALDINDRGEIAGNAFLSNGDTHAFLLIPCDKHHPGVGGCDYGLLDVAGNSPTRPAIREPALTPPTSTPWRRSNRFRLPVLGPRN